MPMVCTAGGHRRLSLAGVLEFVRANKRSLVDPAAIGVSLAAAAGKKRGLSAVKADLLLALRTGEELAAKQIVSELYLTGMGVAELCDDILCETFQEIGRLWECGNLEVYRERLACRICSQLLIDLRGIQPSPPATAPLALGGTPEGDHYELPTGMVELLLRQQGWRATSLGVSLPISTLAAAVRELQPQLFWLSVSHLQDVESFLREYDLLYAAAPTALVVGGRALTEPIRKQMRYAAFCDNLRHLESFLLSRKPPESPKETPLAN